MDNMRFSDWVESCLYPSIDNHPDVVFPEFHFNRKGTKWQSSYHLDGSRNKQGTNVTTIFSGETVYDISRGVGENSISLRMRLDEQTDRVAEIFHIADLLGLVPPCSYDEIVGHGDVEGYKKAIEKENSDNQARFEAWGVFKKALMNDSDPWAVAVMNYFCNVRHWTKEEILEAGIGLTTEEGLRMLPSRSMVKKESYPVVFPCMSSGRIIGFEFRTIGNIIPKYIKETGMSVSSNFIGLSANTDDVVVVEGELDQIHARVRGLSNVVATGGVPKEEQIYDAIKRGVKRITLLFDSDDSGKKFNQDTINICKKVNIECFIAGFPQEKNEKVDCDSYLCDHTNEEFQAIIDRACSAAVFELYEAAGNGDWQEMTSKECHDRRNNIINVIRNARPTDKNELYKALDAIIKNQNLPFSIEDVKMEIDPKIEEQRKLIINNAIKTVKLSIQDGDTLKACSQISDTYRQLEKLNDVNHYKEEFRKRSPEEIVKELALTPQGIPSGYSFFKANAVGDIREERLTLCPGITLLAGGTGQGKTTLLNNIVLNIAKENVRRFKSGEDSNLRPIIYFSLEMSRNALTYDLLNAFVNDNNISNNPRLSIEKYFRCNDNKVSWKYFKNAIFNYEGARIKPFDNFNKKEKEFLTDYLASGAITIIDGSFTVEEMLRSLKMFMKNNNICLVAIDYLQLLHSEFPSVQRLDEIRHSLTDIKDFAIEQKLPFAAAIQFNRQVNNPLDMKTTCIGESGDYERIADTVVGIFNLKTRFSQPGSGESESNQDKRVRVYLEDVYKSSFRSSRPPLYDNNIIVPLDDKILIRLLKRRNGESNMDAIVDWNGKTKYIAPNDSLGMRLDDDIIEQDTIEEDLPLFEEKNGEIVNVSEDNGWRKM